VSEKRSYIKQTLKETRERHSVFRLKIDASPSQKKRRTTLIPLAQAASPPWFTSYPLSARGLSYFDVSYFDGEVRGLTYPAGRACFAHSAVTEK
jgi:hypothetical protein